MTRNPAVGASYAYLTDLSPKDKPWDTHRTESRVVERFYRMNPRYATYAGKVEQCSRTLQFALMPTEGEDSGDHRFKLYAARFCRLRHCPVCQWRRAMMWRARFFKALPRWQADHPSLVPVFLTLTVRNCAGDDLRHTVSEMSKGFRRLTQRKAWPMVGWVRSLEVTRGKDGTAHPHFHVMGWVKPGYFGGNYIRQSEWQSLWQDCMRLDYAPIINIQRVKARGEDDISRAILEVLKYEVKPDELTKHPEWLFSITEQMAHIKAVSVGGELRAYLKEEEPEDLIHDEKLDEEQENLLREAPMIRFDYMDELKRFAHLLPH